MKPLHTAAILDKPVRFFRSPLPGDDLPWHSVDDLWRALGVPRAGRRQLLADTLRDWPNDTRSIVSDGAPVLIAPHWMGQAIAGATDEVKTRRPCSEEIDSAGPVFVAYCNAVKVANDMLLMMSGLTPLEGVSRTMRAVMRQPGEGGGNVH